MAAMLSASDGYDLLPDRDRTKFEFYELASGRASDRHDLKGKEVREGPRPQASARA